MRQAACRPVHALLAAALAAAAGLLVPFSPIVPRAEARPGYPKVANFYIRNQYYFGDVYQLARWDLLVLDVDTPPSIVQQIRALNPSIKILAFIPINGTYASAYLFPPGSAWRGVYDTAASNGWFLNNTQGDYIIDHPGKYTTNLSTLCPKFHGQRYIDWFPSFLVNSVLNGPAQWDGLALDDVWIAIYWIGQNPDLNAYPIDADGNGVADDQATLDQSWYNGTSYVLTRLKQLMPAGKLLLGNGENDFPQLNGAMLETFPYHGYPDPGCPFGYSWTQKMFGTYGYFRNEDFYSPSPGRINIVNAKWEFGDRYYPTDISYFQQHKRFTLVSSMLRDGYYSMDWDEADMALGHNSLWWLPEYDTPIGSPTGAPYQVTSGGVTVWRRNYTNGAVVLNGSNDFFPGSIPDSLPPLAGWDAQIILNGQFWHADLVPPAPVTTLSVSRVWADSAEVSWVNTGDDGNLGNSMRTAVKYLDSPITEANYPTALRNGPGVVSLPAGQLQKLVIRNLAPNHLYYFACTVLDDSGNRSYVSNNTTTFTGQTSGVPDRPSTNRLALAVPSPNPSQGSVSFRLNVPAGGFASLDIVDPAGRRVRRLADGVVASSSLVVDWNGLDDNGSRTPAGIYFAVLESGGDRKIQKVVRTR